MSGTFYDNNGGDATIRTGNDPSSANITWRFRTSDGRVVDPNGNLLALQNEAGAMPVGSIIAFSSNTIPPGFLLCDGEAFDPAVYPDLFRILGKSVTPDLRGMFLRGLDTTGNVDQFGANRSLMSFEEGSFLTGDWSSDTTNFDFVRNNNPGLNWDLPAARGGASYSVCFTSGTGQGTVVGSEGGAMGVARPKNIAVNYIIRARVGMQEQTSAGPVTGSELFTGNLSGNGWTKMSNGLIFQWMTIPSTYGNYDGDVYNYPTPFPNNVFSVMATNGDDQSGGDGANDNAFAYSLSNSQFHASCVNGNGQKTHGIINILAIGI